MSILQTQNSLTGLQFSLFTSPTQRFGPRLGNIVLNRSSIQGSQSQSQSQSQSPASTTATTTQIQIQTPGILTSTSRGVIPHLSPDHYRRTDAIRWVNIPFETFLEHNPPVPTLQRGENPLHTFLGFSPDQHILSMSARDPFDGREMPTNGNGFVSVYSLRGVRKLSPTDWKSYVTACNPDLVIALSDTPLTNPPYSQKRLTKSIERSAAWLIEILRPSTQDLLSKTPNVLVHMSGGTSLAARRAFSNSLVEPLYGPDYEAVKPLQCLDEGVCGYTFDLVPLRLSLEAMEKKLHSLNVFSPPSTTPTPSPQRLSPPEPQSISQIDLDPTPPSHTEQLDILLQESLSPLPPTKLRLINSSRSPHEMLRLISTVGIDIFDAHWAQRTADIGVALDFTFPVPPFLGSNRNGNRKSGKHDLGHNLYDVRYAHDFTSFADSLRGMQSEEDKIRTCPCIACSPIPITSESRLYHGADSQLYTQERGDSSEQQYKPSYTRAYLHHLLHTHEMSAHSLLVAHNISVLDSFFAGIRQTFRDNPATWDEQVAKFENTYDESLELLDEAKVSWKDVELARGKGRLAREKAKQEQATLGTAVELDEF